MKRSRRRWLLIVVFVVAVAAVAAGGVVWYKSRHTTAAVHYLTSTASMGTIAQTVQTNFTLASANAASTVSSGGTGTSSGTGSSSGTSSSSGGVSGTSTTSSFNASGRTTITYATFLAESTGSLTPAPADSGTPTPTPSPTDTGTPTPTPTPTPTRTGTPTPRPTPTKTGRPAPSGGGGSFGGSSGSSAATASSSSTVSAGTSGVVTRIVLPAGATPHTLQRLLAVSGKPLYAFVSTTPLYKNLSTSLSSGSQRANVAALQRALKAHGYYGGRITGDFGTSTETALKKWQKSQGQSQTGKIDITKFVWVPKGAILYSWSVALGNQVTSGSALATVVFPHDLIAQALVSQADISSLKVGQEASLTIDGAAGDPFTGTITSISTLPASSSSTGGSSSTVDYTVVVAPHGLPGLAKSGMTGTLTVTIAKRSNVLLVPTSAVRGTGTSAYVQVMVNGTPTYRQISTGMTTATVTQVTSGLAAGEVVVTGQYSNAASAGSTTTGGGFGFPGLGGGGFRRSGGSSGGFPAGSFPGGAPTGGASGGGQ